MKIAIKFSLSLVAALILAMYSTALRAQEESFSSQELQELRQPQHAELQNIDDDKPLIMDVDFRSTKGNTPSSSNAANGATSQNTKSKVDSANKQALKSKKEEDPLNFNFLYFIIQRFKISDIVDE